MTRHRATVMTIVLLAASAALFVFVAAPRERAARSAVRDLEQERARTLSVQEQRSNAMVAKAQLDRLQMTFDAIDRGFVSESTVLAFIESLERTADGSGVAQEIRNFQVPEQGATTALQLAVQGSFDQILAYLRSVEALSVYLVVDRMTVSGSQTDEHGVLTVTLDVRIFWQ